MYACSIGTGRFQEFNRLGAGRFEVRAVAVELNQFFLGRGQRMVERVEGLH